jgi:EpsI family protein
MKPLNQSWLRFASAMAVLLATAAFLYARSGPEFNPYRKPLPDFPLQLGGYHGRNVAMTQDELQVLGDGQFLHRLYSSPVSPPVDFFIAFFPSQRTGSTIHSPQNCLPGAGWTPVESGHLVIPGSRGDSLTVNRYIIAKGLDRQVVLYWYQSHGRVVASEYWSKYFLVRDSIRLHRSDGALVRIVTPVSPSESEADAQERAVQFSHLVLPQLDSYIPR